MTRFSFPMLLSYPLAEIKEEIRKPMSSKMSIFNLFFGCLFGLFLF